MRLTLMFREYCSLCHAMLAALNELPSRRQFELDIVDVDADPVLEERYNELVPVLLAGERELCHYHLDNAALDAYLASIG
ncbi:MAG: glutaredoxin family protein [Chitinivorax sp.]